MPRTALYVDLDASALNNVVEAYKLTPAQFDQSFKRAAKRTAGTFRRLVSREKLGIEDLRRTTAVRRRIKALFKKNDQTRDGIWFGLNDLWASEYRGTPKVVAGGIQFRGKFYANAYRIKRPGQRYRIFRRVNGKPEEITMPIEQEGLDYIENVILPQLVEAFYHHFLQDAKRHGLRDIRRRS